MGSVKTIYRGVEQLAAHWVHTPKAAGSSPAPATSFNEPSYAHAQAAMQISRPFF